MTARQRKPKPVPAARPPALPPYEAVEWPLERLKVYERNARTHGEEQIAQLRASVRKFGQVWPVLVREDGTIIAGHGRLEAMKAEGFTTVRVVAHRLGWTEVPVLQVDLVKESDRKALNIVFNRGTNDMAVDDHSKALSRELLEKNVAALAETLPDCADRCRALSPVMVPVEALASQTRERYDAHMRNMARALWSRSKVIMPVVATASHRVVNGVGRVQYASEKGWKELPVVIVSEEEADFAGAMLNLLSMDFDIHRRYADLLRHNSFRRARSQRKNLGTGFTALVHTGVVKDWDVTEPANAAAWRRAYGTSVVDFGAGHLHETEILRGIGVKVAAFEPYRLGSGEGQGGDISKQASVALAREFLAAISKGEQYDSVFVSSVFNSVPFAEDRRKIITIVAALCGPRTVFHGNAMTTDHENWNSVIGTGSNWSERRDGQSCFALDYEPGVVLGDFMAKPKVQKYHGAREFYDLIKPDFDAVEIKTIGTNHHVRARGPKFDAAKLREALAFEFDLPYPDGVADGPGR